MNIERCHLVDLPVIRDPRGNLTFIEGPDGKGHIPFDIKRVYYLYDVPGGSQRGGHAHKELHQLIIAMSGSFDIVLDDGIEKKRSHLNRSYHGLYVCPMIWREIDNFSSGAVCMVLASNLYDEADYYRDYDEFIRAAKEAKDGLLRMPGSAFLRSAVFSRSPVMPNAEPHFRKHAHSQTDAPLEMPRYAEVP